MAGPALDDSHDFSPATNHDASIGRYVFCVLIEFPKVLRLCGCEASQHFRDHHRIRSPRLNPFTEPPDGVVGDDDLRSHGMSSRRADSDQLLAMSRLNQRVNRHTRRQHQSSLLSFFAHSSPIRGLMAELVESMEIESVAPGQAISIHSPPLQLRANQRAQATHLPCVSSVST